METFTYYFFKVFNSLKPDCRKIFSCLIVIFLLVAGSANAATFTAVTNGNWNSPGTWGTASTFPGAADVVNIPASISVAVNITNALCSSLNLNSSSSNTTFTPLTFSSSSSFLKVGGTVTLNASSLSGETVTLNINRGQLECNSLSLSGASGNAVVSIYSGTLTVSNTIGLAASTRNSIAFSGSGTMNLGGVISGGKLTPSGSATLNFNGSAMQTFPNTVVVTGKWNIKSNNSAGLFITAILDVGDIAVGDIRTDFPSILSDIPGYSTKFTGGLTMKNGSKFIVGDPDFYIYSSDVLTTGTTIELNSTNTNPQILTIQTTPASFQNLIFSGSNTKSVLGLSAGAQLRVAGNLTIKTGLTYNSNVASIDINGNFDGSSSINSGSRPITIAGNWTNTFTGPVNGLVTYDGTGSQIVGGVGYSDVTFLNTGTKSVNSAASVSGLLSVGANTTLNSNGNLTLLSTATKNANIGPLLAGAQVTGDVKVQSAFTGGTLAYRRYRFVCSPINDASINGLNKKTYEQLKNYMYITSGSGTGFDAGSTTASIQTYDETMHPSLYSYKPIPSIATATTRGTGFALFYRGNKNEPGDGTFKLKAPNAIPENLILTYQGTVNQGPVTVSNLKFTSYPLYVYPAGNVRSDGFNLVGNPYPCTIDFSLIDTVDRPNINKTVYISRPNTTGFSGIVLGAPFNFGSSIIQPGQAFFIQATVNNTSITFRESCKYIAGLKQPMRLLSVPENNTFSETKTSKNSSVKVNSETMLPKLLRINLQDALNIDETLITFKTGNNLSYNITEDAGYMGGSSVTLNSLSEEGNPLLYNGMPDISELKEIKLNVNSSTSQQVTLNFTDLAALGNYQLFLKDGFLNKLVDVKANPAYAFDIDKTVAGSYGLNRFVLAFQPPVSMQLTSFTAIANKGAELKWVAIHEENNNYFELEHSTDGQTFTRINKIQGKAASSGSSSYTYLDKDPVNGINYYRLKQVDLEGKISYTNTLSLTYTYNNLANAEAGYIVVYPNPAQGAINVDIPNRDLKSIRINILDLQGKKVRSTVLGSQDKLQQDISGLNTGAYIIEVINASTNELIGRKKVIKML
jgi:trimeric autotransporter adhesin